MIVRCDIHFEFRDATVSTSACLRASVTILAALAIVIAVDCQSAAAESNWVTTGTTGRLIYVPDTDGDRVLDFSDVGYKGKGTALIPGGIQNVITLSPVAGDDTATIQAAINLVAAMPLGPDGYRGAVLLQAGDYDINTQLTIGASGVVLRGEGRDASGSVLHARGTTQRALIEVAGTGSQSLFGSTRNLIDKVVPVGSRSFRVDVPGEFSVGDMVRVERPSPQNWIDDLGMNPPPGSGGGPGDDPPWSAGSFNLRFDRVITRIEGNRIFVDAPLPNSFDQQYGGGTIKRYSWSERIENVGIENLRGDSDYASDTDENHALEFITIDSAQNVWIRQITSTHFSDSAVYSQPGAKWVTVDDAISIDPKGPIAGGWRYTYDLSGELELVTNSQADQGRHDFVNNSTRPPGPHVFHNSIATNANSDTGPHQRWATGTLFDNITVQGDAINARNRGDLGTGHGWSGANMVIWNSTADSFRVQNPPTAQNWLIGSTGTIVEDTTYGPQPSGYYDSHGSPVTVGGTDSLYEAQVNDAADIRQFHWAGGVGQWSDALEWDQSVVPDVYVVSLRDYLIGDIDNFTNDGGGSVDDAFLEPAWETYIQGSSALPITGFDDLAGNQNVAFTIQHVLDAGERVVHGSLALGLKQGGGGLVNTDFVRLFDSDPAHKIDFTTLGWDTEINTTDTFSGVLDLGMFLDQMQTGSVNVQLNDDSGLDWAIFTVAVATPIGDPAGPDVFLGNGGIVTVDSDVDPIGSLMIGGAVGSELSLAMAGSVEINNDFTQTSNGTLTIELGGTGDGQFGTIQVGNNAELDGVLEVQLAGGFDPVLGNTFAVLSADGELSDIFATELLPPLSTGLAWNVNYDYTNDMVILEVVASGLAGDYNGNNVVDAADYTVWRDMLGQIGMGLAADGTGDNLFGTPDGDVDEFDFLFWRANFGNTLGSGSAATVAVPEPSSIFLLISAICLFRTMSVPASLKK